MRMALSVVADTIKCLASANLVGLYILDSTNLMALDDGPRHRKFQLPAAGVAFIKL